MRRNLLIAACAVIFAQGAVFAGFKVPSAVFELSELEAAQAKARERRKPIAVIYTNCESTCGLCRAASKTIIDELDSKTIMVYMPNNLEKWPAFVKTAKAFKRGKYIPKVAVFDAELKQIIGEVIYEEIKQDGDDAFDDLHDAIKAYRKTLPKR